ncbi:hypothetical protein CDL12_03198 [Handroanthus impetiginosus]|uniref:Ribosomal protein L34Ae n=1 Tax=Handroanthus impetiginosus TaxID=429701 RepID=A0A2G9I2T5_9LAMI|nr:hypothetical protein CDL12_03198 [Handroanthus impetiginosus]
MGTIKFYAMLKSPYTLVDTRLSEFLLKTMFKFGAIFLASVYTLMLKISGFLSKYIHRSKPGVAEGNGSNFSVNRSQKDDEVVPKNSTIFRSSGNVAETEDSVCLQKCQFMSEKNVSGYLEEPKTVNFVVQEMFVGSNEVLGCEIPQRNDFFEQDSRKNLQEFFEEPGFHSSFYFKLLSDSCFNTQEQENIGQERTDNLLKSEEVYGEKEKQNSAENSKELRVEDDFLEDQDFSYEVEFLEENNQKKPENLEVISNIEDLDDEYIELDEKKIMQSEGVKSADNSEEPKNCWDLDSDNDEDEADVLLEHQNLVQQMKVELKNCRIGGLPTISEECETPKMLEDLKPLKIDQKIEYKDITEEIQKFYKSYMEKMKKLDILNYQTLHAISFLQLKDSGVFTASKKKGNSVPLISPKIWPYKVQRIYADPMHKSIMEMHSDLELVYVGQLCLSWEILNWLHMKARDLLEYDSNGNHSYNRAAEEFQQFQVLLQRFVEDEPFQEQRIQNYVKTRCVIRSLLQVPLVKDDCLKAKKERSEEPDAISLEMLVEIIRESMEIFREFLFADKRATNVVLKGIQGTKVDLQENGNSELLLDIITNLQKKERRMREHVTSQNCILKKMKKHKDCRLDNGLLKSQIELRLVSRVLSLSRLTEDQLVWCSKKLNNINIVNRKIRVESSFLLFPC